MTILVSDRSVETVSFQVKGCTCNGKEIPARGTSAAESLTAVEIQWQFRRVNSTKKDHNWMPNVLNV